jgi:hypothetical protein
MDCSVTRNTKDKPGPVFQTASLLLSASRFIILFPRVKACPDAVSNSSRDERPIWVLFVKTVVRAATRVPITWYQRLCLSISTRTSQPSRNVRRLCTRTVPFQQPEMPCIALEGSNLTNLDLATTELDAYGAEEVSSREMGRSGPHPKTWGFMLRNTSRLQWPPPVPLLQSF